MRTWVCIKTASSWRYYLSMHTYIPGFYAYAYLMTPSTPGLRGLPTIMHPEDCCDSNTTKFGPTRGRAIHNKGKLSWKRSWIESNAFFITPMILIVKIGQYNYVWKGVKAQGMIVLPVDRINMKGQRANMGLVKQRLHQVLRALHLIKYWAGRLQRPRPMDWHSMHAQTRCIYGALLAG